MEEHSLLEIAQTLAFPWIFMFQSLSCLPGTLVRLAREGTLISHLLGRGGHGTLTDTWFSDFWTKLAAPGVRASASASVIPLLAGRVHKGAVVESQDSPPPHPAISGTVLEVGPGSGMWASVLARSVFAASSTDDGVRHRRPGPGPGVTRILGVEPNAGVHESLRRAADEAGLQDVYEVVPCGIQDLAASGAVAHGEVDCIVSVLCLCSIPDPERNIRELYRYLRPGGRWYVCEHVRQEPGTAMYWYQGMFDLIFFVLSVGSSFPGEAVCRLNPIYILLSHTYARTNLPFHLCAND